MELCYIFGFARHLVVLIALFLTLSGGQVYYRLGKYDRLKEKQFSYSQSSKVATSDCSCRGWLGDSCLSTPPLLL